MAGAVLLAYAAAVAAYHARADRWSPAPPFSWAPKAMGAAVVLLLSAGAVLAVRADGWWAGLGALVCTLMLAGVAVCCLAPVRPVLTRRSGAAALLGAAPALMIG